MSFWLVKSEPSVYSWQQLLKDKRTCWDGVRNYAARLHLKEMKQGDKVFFYHSNTNLHIAGIARVEKEAYPDPKDKKWVAVDLVPFKSLKKPVTLEMIKAEKKLKNMALVRIGRLSVSPVSHDEFEVINKLSGK
ncbi:MAG: EVE domain-containing protein [Bacteroidia bacterium]|nr:EVE domain-containing protein [Bacteroidia bacterium]